MRAVVLDGVGMPVDLRQVAEPALQPGGAIVRLEAAALNHRDVWIQAGRYPGLRFPVVLGSDGAGVVEAVDREGDRDWVGRLVIINPGFDWGPEERAQGPKFRILGLPDDGTLAEAVAVPVANLAVRPSRLTPAQAAALPLSGLTAWRALFARGGLCAGETVLITGAGGGTAMLALKFALAAGAMVYVTSGSDEKLAKARKLGAAGGANYRDAGWPARLREQAGSFDLVVDGAQGESLASLIDLTRPGGRIVCYGATAGNPPGLNARKVFFRQISLLGTTAGSPADFAAMAEFVSSRGIEPVIDSILPLSQAEAALRRLESGRQIGKIVLTPV